MLFYICILLVHGMMLKRQEGQSTGEKEGYYLFHHHCTQVFFPSPTLLEVEEVGQQSKIVPIYDLLGKQLVSNVGQGNVLNLSAV